MCVLWLHTTVLQFQQACPNLQDGVNHSDSLHNAKEEVLQGLYIYVHTMAANICVQNAYYLVPVLCAV